MSAIIPVNFGSLQVAGVISLSGLSVMNDNVYKKVREKSDTEISINALGKKYVYDVFDQEYQVIENVNMNVTIEAQVFTVTVLILKNIHVDFVLGRSILSQIKPVFHFGLNLLKWHNGNKINVTRFSQNQLESLVTVGNDGTSGRIPDVFILAFNYKQNPSTTPRNSVKNEEIIPANQKCNLMVIRVHFGSLQVAAAIAPQGISAMSDKVFQKVRNKSEVKITTYPSTDEYIYGMMNEAVKVLETVVLEATIGGQTVPISILVLKDLSFDMVLGYDFVDGKNADIDYRGKQLWLRQGIQTYTIPFIQIAYKTLWAITDEDEKRDPNSIILSVTLLRKPKHSQPRQNSSNEDCKMSFNETLNRLNVGESDGPKRKGKNKGARKVR